MPCPKTRANRKTELKVDVKSILQRKTIKLTTMKKNITINLFGTLYNIDEFFSEEFFDTKKGVYLPL